MIKNANKKPKVFRKQKVERTRNGGTMTESQFWSFIRLSLRNKSRWWKPRLFALKDSRRKSQSLNKRIKWEYQCKKCENWFIVKNVEIHHSIPVGTLKNSQDLPMFVERLFSETGWVCLCKTCHSDIHKK